jgi:hypothetical protein
MFDKNLTMLVNIDLLANYDYKNCIRKVLRRFVALIILNNAFEKCK